jgi:hypothetical protein
MKRRKSIGIGYVREVDENQEPVRGGGGEEKKEEEEEA